MTAFDGLTMRPITAEEFTSWGRATETTFFEEPSDEALERWREITELDRTLAVFDGDDIVATAGTLSYRLTVPGGELGMGGLTAVGVLPTHRRRGILRAMMTRQLADVAEAGEPLAGLFAAEAPIYGRYGYGMAAPNVYSKLATRHTRFHDAVAVERGVRFVDVEEALATFPAIHDAVRDTRPGMPNRGPKEWRAWLTHDPEDDRDGYSRRHLARLGERGYVIYRGKGSFEQGLPDGKLVVIEHMASDVVAAASLWRFLFDVDLVGEIEVNARPTDDELPLLLADPRRLRSWTFDGLWLRLVHLDAALTGRAYETSGEVVLDVGDELCPWNAGTWRLEAGPDGVSCTRTGDAADVRVATAGLAAAFLGSVPLARQVRAGAAQECTAGAARRADLLFATDPAPWCPQEF
ncbi:MAG: GNAT family N-acetyltransferase [Actinomycetota bacterium]|nr:GNAT family N-acetyltransferase [Actinomycetota bacterium]